jgi:hypothetical protein
MQPSNPNGAVRLTSQEVEAVRAHHAFFGDWIPALNPESPTGREFIDSHHATARLLRAWSLNPLQAVPGGR